MSGRNTISATPGLAPAPSIPQLIVASATLGAAFGLLEAIIQVVRMLLKSPDPMGFPILWVAPVFYALVGLAYGCCLGLVVWLGRRLPRLPGRVVKQIPRGGLGLLAVLGYFNAATLVFATSPWAVWLLALGLAYQTIRLLDRGRLGAVSRLARGGPWMAGVVALLAVTVTVGKFIREQTFLAGIPTARNDAPNVLLITLDTLRADHVSAYGYSRPTPALDRLATEGLQFDYAIATASWTLPSHATMMTGLLTHEHHADMTGVGRLDERYHTLAEAFAENGYVTGAFVANEYAAAANQGFGQGFSHFNDLFWSVEDMVRWTKLGERLRLRLELSEALRWPQIGRKTAAEVNREFLSWLPGGDDRPFFAWLNYFDPHDPYYAPAPYHTWYGDKPALGDPGSFGVVGSSDWGGILSPEETQWQMDAYDSSIAYLDAQLGALFDALRTSGLYDDTVVVVTSDHGEGFGEHDLYGHANSLYRETLHVPLIIRYPKSIPAGHRIASVVSLRDLAATISDLAGLAPRQAFAGAPIHVAASSEPAPAELMHNRYHPPSHPVARGNLTSLTSDAWHAIFLQPADGSETQIELYERDDVADQMDLKDTLAGQGALHQLQASRPAPMVGPRSAGS